MSQGQHRQANKHKKPTSRAGRFLSKLKRGGQPITLKRLEDLLKKEKKP